MRTRLAAVIAWSVCVVFVVAATAYVFGSDSPPSIITRIQFVVIAAAVLGIPLGICLGTQDKFWT